ncbi:MAG: TraR/DksA family transcriptional regulator [Prolixibacteraceae bacterium]|nr:TraR/DksA family transcriptional regulator [Prolixibacteraceae bacterium]
MPAPDKTEIKSKIESEIRKTEKLISEYAELTRPVEPENAIGRISRMDAIQNKSVTEAALRKAREKLEKLKFALSKINDENFGICIQCKTAIPVGRLLIMPQSQTCVKCSR